MNRRRSDLVRFALSAGIVLVSAFLLSFYFFKIDLTEEKRHSLTPSTISMLESMDDNMYIRCYLHGEFPAGFKHLEQSIRERLDEFHDYSGGKIEYEFIDPYDGITEKEINETFAALEEKGLQYTSLTFNENGKQSSKYIWPGAIVEYKGREYPIQLLKSRVPVATDQMINSSVNNLEFELASSIRKITREDRPAIGVLTGHGELGKLEIASFVYGLLENYDVEAVKLDGQIAALSDKLDGLNERQNRYAALIVAGPDSLVSDKDRFILDQFLMNGGKILWLMDAMQIDLDSLRAQETVMALSNENGVYEMLFEYGVRLNRSIVVDFQGAPIVVDDGQVGNQRNYANVNNYYAPLVMASNNNHAIASNLDPIKFEFAGSLDSVNPNPEVIKVPLLRSSPLSKEFRAPVRIDLGLLRQPQSYFANSDKKGSVLAMMLEGQFPSAFRDQTPAAIKNDPNIAYREKSKPTKMIVIADKDVARNYVDYKQNPPMPYELGYERNFGIIYDNKEFLLNCMNYLLDDANLISVRSRTIQLRKLDKAKVNDHRSAIKVANTALPAMIIVVAGILQFVVRRRKWSRTSSPEKR